MGEKYQMELGPNQCSNTIHGQVRMLELLNKTQEEYLQLHFISSI